MKVFLPKENSTTDAPNATLFDTDATLTARSDNIQYVSIRRERMLHRETNYRITKCNDPQEDKQSTTF